MPSPAPFNAVYCIKCSEPIVKEIGIHTSLTDSFDMDTYRVVGFSNSIWVGLYG